MNRRRWFVTCALAAFVGPILSFVAARAYPEDDQGVLGAIVLTSMQTASLLWPPQLLGTVEYGIGPLLAEIALDALNVCLYLFLGWMIVLAARRTWGLVLLSGVILAYLLVFSWWSAGYDLKFMDWTSLTLGAAFFGSLILVGARVTPARSKELK